MCVALKLQCWRVTGNKKSTIGGLIYTDIQKLRNMHDGACIIYIHKIGLIPENVDQRGKM